MLGTGQQEHAVEAVAHKRNMPATRTHTTNTELVDHMPPCQHRPIGYEYSTTVLLCALKKIHLLIATVNIFVYLRRCDKSVAGRKQWS